MTTSRDELLREARKLLMDSRYLGWNYKAMMCAERIDDALVAPPSAEGWIAVSEFLARLRAVNVDRCESVTDEEALATIQFAIDAFLSGERFGPEQQEAVIRLRELKLRELKPTFYASGSREQGLEEAAKVCDEQVAHIRDNAARLREYEGMGEEARARQLGALYVSETAESIRSLLARGEQGK